MRYYVSVDDPNIKLTPDLLADSFLDFHSNWWHRPSNVFYERRQWARDLVMDYLTKGEWLPTVAYPDPHDYYYLQGKFELYVEAFDTLDD